MLSSLPARAPSTTIKGALHLAFEDHVNVDQHITTDRDFTTQIEACRIT